MPNKNPTNSDLYKLLGKLEEKIDQVFNQTVKTNGRVTRLESWKQAIEAVDSYKKENPSLKTPQEKAEGWSVREKTLAAIIMSLLAIVSALVGAGKIGT